MQEDLKIFKIREATINDVSKLAQLHVDTFHETHGKYPGSPTYEIREGQWQQLLHQKTSNTFCLVIENDHHELIGFARGIPYSHEEHSEYKGELNKIYLLRKYHRIGLGKKLLCYAAQKFLAMNISSMLLFGDTNNPSNNFYEAMSGEKLYGNNGSFNGGYGWRDLNKLVQLCS